MSTRCLIGIRENNKVEYIYCHHDGYVEGVGETLLKHYNYYDTKRLMQLGDLSTLGNQPKSLKILWDKNFFSNYFCEEYMDSYREISTNYCTAYKDRGETDVDSKLVDANDYGFNCQSDADYIYLFDEETRTWLYIKWDMDQFEKLTLD